MPNLKEKGVGAGTVLLCLIILGGVGYGGYTFYTESEAIDSLEFKISPMPTIKDVGLTSATVGYALRFTNNSPYDTPPFSLTYTVLINGVPIATGEMPEMVIRAHSFKDTTLSFKISYLDVGRALWNALTTGNFDISIDGTIHAKLLFGLIPVSKTF